MSERQGITLADVRDIAAGAIAGWADGWTGDDGVNPQRRVRVTGGDNGYVALRVEGAPGTDEPDRLFRVLVVVTETLPGAEGRQPAQHGPWDQYAEYIAPVETGEPFRGAAERDWDASRGD
jgi:hypothetical protein